MNKQYAELAIDAVITKYALRQNMGDLASLEKSIRQLGLLHPIVVDRDNVLISGSRRLEASRMAGLEKIPVTRLDIGYQEMSALDVQSDANICHKPLTSEELEAHIARKEAVLKGKRPEGGNGVLGWFKKVFSKA